MVKKMRSYSRLYAILPDNILYANHYKITDTRKKIIFPAENGLRPLKPARLGQSTADAANALYANPNATFPVVFDSLDEATSYAKGHIKKGKSEVTDIDYQITTKTPYYQPAIVEIYIEDEKEAKSGKHLTTHPANYFMRMKLRILMTQSKLLMIAYFNTARHSLTVKIRKGQN